MKIALKFSKKSVFVILITVGGIAFLGTLFFLFTNFSYQWNHIVDNIEDIINEEETIDESIEQPIAEDVQDTSDIITNGGFSDVITCGGDDYSIVASPNGAPQLITSKTSIFKNADKANHIYDFDKDSVHYLAGTVSGHVGEVNIPSNTKYYIGFYQDYSIGDFGDAAQIRYFIYNENVYVLTSDGYLTEDVLFNGEEYTTEEDDGYGLLEKGLLETNVRVLLPSKDYGSSAKNCFDDATYSSKYIEYTEGEDPSFFRYSFISEKDTEFIPFFHEFKTLAQMSGYTQVDSYNGLKVLSSKTGKYILENREGFVESLRLVTAWFDSFDEFPISWNDGTVTNIVYNSQIGTCEVSLDGPADYVYEDVSVSDLTQVGVAFGANVYQKKNLGDDTFTRKIYDEDYVASGYSESNLLEEDDSEPFTYDVYLTYHPVIYMKDPYGKYIRLTNQEFFMAGGCAKPAIYLYPSETTDISVKVIPNGNLTFTYPKYGNGWNVIAQTNGDLVNKADGKTYDYLWWDSYTYNLDIPERGFVVEKMNVGNFLEEKLLSMGLNENEKREFKSYWVEKIERETSDYIFVTFLFNKEVDQIAQLNVSPTPESSFRVFMLYKPVVATYDIAPLKMESVDRNGYTLVEWGGAKI